jgi:hypothetical protein
MTRSQAQHAIGHADRRGGDAQQQPTNNEFEHGSEIAGDHKEHEHSEDAWEQGRQPESDRRPLAVLQKSASTHGSRDSVINLSSTTKSVKGDSQFRIRAEFQGLHARVDEDLVKELERRLGEPVKGDTLRFE